MTKQPPTALLSPHLAEAYEYERALLDRAVAGEDIRDEAILHLRPTIERMARRLYQRRSPLACSLQSIEISDLMQEAYLRMLTVFPDALEREKPFRWLTGAAYGAMRDCLNGRGDTIKRHTASKPVQVLSLDWPLNEQGTTLSDLLSEPSPQSTSLCEATLTALEHALSQLSQQHRALLESHFGLRGRPVSLNQICRELHPNRRGNPNSSYLYRQALAKLRRALIEALPGTGQHSASWRKEVSHA